MSEPAHIVRINGALVEARPLGGAALYEVARVGDARLFGEVVRIDGETATLQVYEETSGLRLGEPVVPGGSALQATLGPGLLGSVLDGVGRPLLRLAAQVGDFIQPGSSAPTLDPERRFAFQPALQAGARISGGDVLGRAEESEGLWLPVLAPPRARGTLARLEAGAFRSDDPIGALQDGTPLTLAHRWPVREARPVAEPLPGDVPLLTNQRVFDLLFPVAEGGTVAVPGGFGTGKTIIEHSLARHADADVVVFVGCGERGNEMADALTDFARLKQPKTGRPLLERTVLVVNTSNMPVPAREASIYLGLTIAEYFRDLGLRVALLADSLSRWAEALREMGARLREMPGEEGYPVYLASRLGKLFERAGRARALGSPRREGSVTLIAAFSPPGGDFSEPVTQAALRVAGALWALDAGLAHQRQFPAVDVETSFSRDAATLAPAFAARVDPGWPAVRAEILALLSRDREVRDVAALVGPEALQDEDRLVLEVARLAREALLGQHAFDPNDASSPPEKTHLLGALILELLRAGTARLQAGTTFGELPLAPLVTAIARLPRAAPSDLQPQTTQVRARIAALAKERAP